MITKLFYFDSPGKNFKAKLRHQVVEAEALRVEAEAVQKLLLPHPWFHLSAKKCKIFFGIFAQIFHRCEMALLICEFAAF